MLAKQYSRLQRMVFPVTSGLPAKSMFDIIQGTDQLDIHLEDWEKDRGAGNYFELTALATIVKRFSPKVCFEIGTGHGRSTLQIANNTSAETKIYSLDISDQHPVGCILVGKKANAKIKRIVANSGTYDFSPFYGKVDFVLIDGAHDFENVDRDTQNAFNMISPVGIIIWDDFSPSWPDVVRCLNKYYRQGKRIFRIPGTSYVIFQNQLLV